MDKKGDKVDWRGITMKVMGINCFIFSESSNGVDKLSTPNVDL